MRWFVQDIVPKSAAPVQCPHLGLFLLVFWSSPGEGEPPSPLWGQLTSRMDPLWLGQLPPFILCTVQTVLFSRCALILKRLWRKKKKKVLKLLCYTVSLGSSLTGCLDSSRYSVEDCEFRMGSYWSSSLLTPG